MTHSITPSWDYHRTAIARHRQYHNRHFISVWENFLRKTPEERAFSTGFDKSHYEIMLRRLNLAINLFVNCDLNIQDQLMDCRNEIDLAHNDLVLITADLDKTMPLSLEEKVNWKKTHIFATQLLSKIDELILSREP